MAPLVLCALVLCAVLVAASSRAVSAAGGGTIEAEVKYAGQAVTPKRTKVNKDTETCGAEAVSEELVVGPTQGLAYAVVSVPAARVPGERKAALDQRGCRFVPHVIAMTPGAIEITNSDGILHDFHTYSTRNAPVHKPQPKFKKTMVEKFEQPEIVKVTCDVHPWMLGWIVVSPTSAVGVTDQAGLVKIENVPAGKHTVEVWHELLGKVTKDVEVRPGQTTRVGFEMKAAR